MLHKDVLHFAAGSSKYFGCVSCDDLDALGHPVCHPPACVSFEFVYVVHVCAWG